MILTEDESITVHLSKTAWLTADLKSSIEALMSVSRDAAVAIPGLLSEHHTYSYTKPTHTHRRRHTPCSL